MEDWGCALSRLQQAFLTLAGCSIFVAGAYGQSVISAKAGLIHYVEGKVLIGDKVVTTNKVGDFPEMKQGEILRTEEGRVEVLLTPGVFLRMSDNSSFKLVSSRLEDVRLELLTGSVLIEAAEVTKHDSIVLTTPKGAEVNITKRGLFRLDEDPESLRVYDGEAVVTAAGETLTVKEGKRVNLSGVLVTEKFDKEAGDAFYRWAGRRSGYLAAANLVAARSAYNSGTSFASGSWLFNPYLGYFTYLPIGRNYISPWGYAYYTPRRVEAAYYRAAPIEMGRSNGSADSGMRPFPDSSGRMSSQSTYSGGGYSSAPAPAPSSAPAAPAAAPRGGDGGGSRGSGGGR
jgi:FecR protein